MDPQPERAIPAYDRPERRGIPPILVALLSGAGILALLAILYVYILPGFAGRSGAEATTASARLEEPSAPGAGGSGHPLAKYLEISGIRIQSEKDGRARIQMLVVNHSNAELPAMKMQTELIAADRGLFEFDVDLPSMGPYESREVNTVLKTGLKPYELPDWQHIRPRFRLTDTP
jgi:hypothetical protein